MKLSKTTWIFLAIGIFIIAFASLSMAHSQQGKEQSQLNQKLSLAQLLLTKQSANFSPEKFSSQQGELKSQLAQAESQLETAKASLRQSIESIEVTETLLEVAEACEVEIIGISSGGVTSKQIEGVTCSVLLLTVRVKGDVPNLNNFILNLSRKFTTSVVESVTIDVPEVSGAEEETEEEVKEELEKPSASLKLCIYTYEGD